MRKAFSVLGVAGVVLLSVSVSSASAGSPRSSAPQALPAHSIRHVCAAARTGAAACASRVVTTLDGARPLATPTYTYGYSPQNLASAYKWGSPTGSTWTWNGQTIAIVDAYHNPYAYVDVTTYRQQFGLPPCTKASGCFRQVNQNGATSPLPSGNTGWGQEIDLDIEMVSAVCPQCKILLVEANSNSLTDLGAAVNRAATMGATAISNSYGTNGEFLGETSYDSYYNHPNIAVTVSSGDSGYGVEFPAASNHVVAVGGTSLSTSSNARGWIESVWGGAGSGCSAYYSNPSWQTDTGCSRRTVADVSAVADPSTGVAVYDSYGSSNGNNWYVFGGTSVSSPIIASVYGLAGNAATVNYPAKLAYASPGKLFDVTSGSNGHCTTGNPRKSGAAYLCTGVAGYDGPTGLGTPNGTGAF
jgi:subtilase family serine protease